MIDKMIKENIGQIQSRIQEATKRVDRDGGEVTLIGVSKTYPVEDILQASTAGITCFGENKVQELTSKIEAIGQGVAWHFIGHLQTNKVKYIVGEVALIHSLDRIKLAKEIDKQSEKKGVITNVLIEVNVAKEASKHGLYPEEVLSFVEEVSRFKNIKVRGLMTVAPFVEDPEENRLIFRRLYQLSVDIQKQNIDNISTDVLSMGMSNDFEIAIEEGATMIRVGTSIFGKRDYSKV